MQATNQLTPRHNRIVDFAIRGLKAKEIAERLGLTQPYVCTIMAAPNFQHQLAIRRSKFEDQADEQLVRSDAEAADVLKESAKDAAKRMVELMEGESESISFKASADIMDRVGPQKQQRDAQMQQNIVIVDEKAAVLIKETLMIDEKREDN